MNEPGFLWRAAPPMTPPKRGRPRGGSSSLLAHGEPMVWLTGGMLALCLVMILGLIGAIVALGLRTFWPGPVERVVAVDGATLLGEPDQVDRFAPTPEYLQSLSAEDRDRAAFAASDGRLLRRRLRTGDGTPDGRRYAWIEDFRVRTSERPEWGTVVDRFEGGRVYGILRGFREDGVDQCDDGDAAEALRLFQRRHPEVLALRAQGEALERDAVGPLNHERSQAELELKKAEARHGVDSPPWREAADRLAEISERIDRRLVDLRRRIDALKERQNRFQLVFETAKSPAAVVPLAEVVRAYPANRMSLGEKWSVYLDRWREFVSTGPREGNAEGGVFPALVGTLVMTLLMSVAVVPLGVMAAVYLREYAPAGLVVSVTRIAINNLAGVPSIVFGVFGLGFFVYICGTTIDELFFPVRPTSAGVFAQGGVLWASLTLALLTLPVVIVATEESLAAVPNSMREGSYACGASKWQTIRRIVLPRATPGVLTGLILAVARGAGEVAPLMLVGAASYAPELPVDDRFPFVHPERQFMHLAYSIYWTSTQSPNSEAARPLVFTMTLLLIALIAVLNLLAIWLRSRIRRRFALGAF